MIVLGSLILCVYSIGQLSVKLQLAHWRLQYMRKAFNTFCGYRFRAEFYVSLQLVLALCVQH